MSLTQHSWQLPQPSSAPQRLTHKCQCEESTRARAAAVFASRAQLRSAGTRNTEQELVAARLWNSY
eukprot:6200303-Pleurochrysis_carterae.AAC.1